MELQIIQQKIFEIRGQKVMFDFDLAALYEVERRSLNQAVKRNIESFPEDFMFQITREEYTNLKSQIVISSWGGARSLPYAFTEHGITMVASILKSTKARKMNIAIVRAFIALRKFAAQYGDIIEQLHDLRERIGNHDAQLNQIYEALENLLDEKVEAQVKKDNWANRERIGFKK
ncbi:MAG: ORF6N domain-containing protein [Flavobacterium sp.]|nr:ORF6N domain-containing protein [Flavobacterium sp.]